ncbi:hypothetical protein D3C72_2031970 [compost metagenome]
MLRLILASIFSPSDRLGSERAEFQFFVSSLLKTKEEISYTCSAAMLMKDPYSSIFSKAEVSM